MSPRVKATAAALTIFAVWTLATWVLEGRIETLLRPDAAADRAIYAVIANVLIGTVGAVAVLRHLVATGSAVRRKAGFGSVRRTIVAVPCGLALGLAFYLAQGGPAADSVVLLNAFAQVLVVSVAEVVVCWALVGVAFEAAAGGRAKGVVAGVLAASVSFGLYHFAHSAPFNTLGMVMLLTAVGLVTSLFFFVSRDVYGAIALHNFLGVFGVVRSLDAQGKLAALTEPQIPLLVMAILSLAVLVLGDYLLLRRARPRRAAAAV